MTWLKSRLNRTASRTLLVLSAAVLFAVVGWLAASSFEPAFAAAVNGSLATLYVGGFLARQKSAEDPSYSGGVTELRRQVEGVRRAAIYDETTGLLNRWFFEMRLAEELTRSRRYSLSTALLVIRIFPPATAGANQIEWEMMAARVAHQALRTVRAADIPAAIGDMEYAVCLVHCDRRGAEAATQRLREELEAHRFQIGIAVFPEDEGQAKELIDIARGRVDVAADAA